LNIADGTQLNIESFSAEDEVDNAFIALSKEAKISGIGTSIVTVEGVSKLNSIEYSVCSDRIKIDARMVLTKW
jgi:UDP-N-acetylglucosamine 1-carboxyvinyltransferase